MLVMFESDKTLYPAATAVFQELDEDKKLVPYKQTPLYKNDFIGLK